MDDIHTIDSQAHAHIAQCSAGNIMLWGRFIESFGLQEMTANVLAKEYHSKRVRIMPFFRNNITQHWCIYTLVYCLDQTFVGRIFSS